ncbi:hypothetical protein Kisp02_54490 [Kineosporia sp. NBRC 101731]|nr:hypothetical protein Kisp02_54490 [Kineosporia sp. NBRC 101731]
MLPPGETTPLRAPTPSSDKTWRRVIWVAAISSIVVILICMAVCFAAAYRFTYTAGFDTVWIDTGARQVRPAHLVPLTLDLTVLVAYLARLALTGRPSAAYATLVLVICSAVTIAVQVTDGWITGTDADMAGAELWARVLIHGWPAALMAITAHLLMLMLHALGYLVPPAYATTQRLPLLTRAGRSLAQLAADIRGVIRAAKRGDMDRDIREDTRPDAPAENHPDAQPDTLPDTAADTTEATRPDTAPDTAPDTQPDAEEDTDAATEADTGPDIGPDKLQVIPKIAARLSLKERRIVDAWITGDITQAEAARKVGKTPRTISRWVERAPAKSA